MGKVDWKDPEAKDRLIAALWLGTGGGWNYKKIGHYLGTTYDSVEGQTRKYRKMADELKREFGEFDPDNVATRPARSANTTPRKPKTPKKDSNAQNGVLSGRVTKNGSPSKKRDAAKVKQESGWNSPAAFSLHTPVSMQDDADCGIGTAVEDEPATFGFDFDQPVTCFDGGWGAYHNAV